MTNMSGCEETKRSAPGVGTPLGLNRLEMSTFSGVNCSYHQFDYFDHFFSTQFDRSLEREDTGRQPSRNDRGKKLSGSKRCWQISTTTLPRRSIIVEQTVVDKKGVT